MLNTLERYIAVSIFKATALITFIVTGVLFLLSILGELKNIGHGDYGLTEALIYVLLRLPNLIYQFSPLLLLLGSILGLSLLYTHREIIVMRTSGFSVLQIIKSVLLSALILILCIGTIGEYLGPKLSYRAVVRKENTENAGQAVVTNKGIWLHIDNNFIHAQRIVNKQLLKGVTTYQFDDQHRLLASYYAKMLAYKNNQWEMQNVVETRIYDDHTTSASYDNRVLDIKLNPNLFNVGLIDPEEMSLPRLANFADYLRKNGLEAKEYEYSFWKRIFQPLASVIMIMLAVPFVLGAIGNSAVGFRIMMGVLFGFGFFIMDAFLGQLSIVYQLPAVVAAAVPSVIFMMAVVFLTRRVMAR